MTILFFFYIFLTSLLVSLVMVPSVARLAVRIGGVDTPDDRKIHCTETPRLGGIAIFCAFLFSVLFFMEVDRQIKSFLAGAVVIFLTGLADDLTGLSPRNKLLGEIVAATVAVVSGGIYMTTLGNPLGLGEIELGQLAIPFTIFAVVGVMNAINLIDGLDGLAGGVSVVAALVFGVFAWKCNNVHLLTMICALIGAIAGFMRYNTYPARIFMGDSGSLFLGYCMGFFAVILLRNSQGGVSPVAPLMILGVPILDTLIVMVRRKWRGFSISKPDKTHLHHRMLDLGFGHRFSVLLVYGLSYILAFSALLLHGVRDVVQLSLLGVFCIVIYGGVQLLTVSGSFKATGILHNESSLKFSKAFRTLVQYSQKLLIAIKYLIVLILALVVLVSPGYPMAIVAACAVITAALIGLMVIRHFSADGWLRVVIYLSGLTGVFIVENYGRTQQLLGVNLLWVSHMLFVVLIVAVAIKVIVRKKAEHLIVTPFEYLLLFVVIAIPLMPTSLNTTFHCMSIAAKSVVLFVAYKLVLLRTTRNNRKILAVTVVALAAVIIRYMFG